MINIRSSPQHQSSFELNFVVCDRVLSLLRWNSTFRSWFRSQRMVDSVVWSAEFCWLITACGITASECTSPSRSRRRGVETSQKWKNSPKLSWPHQHHHLHRFSCKTKHQFHLFRQWILVGCSTSSIRESCQQLYRRQWTLSWAGIKMFKRIQQIRRRWTVRFWNCLWPSKTRSCSFDQRHNTRCTSSWTPQLSMRTLRTRRCRKDPENLLLISSKDRSINKLRLKWKHNVVFFVLLFCWIIDF